MCMNMYVCVYVCYFRQRNPVFKKERRKENSKKLLCFCFFIYESGLVICNRIFSGEKQYTYLLITAK